VAAVTTQLVVPVEAAKEAVMEELEPELEAAPVEAITVEAEPEAA
jgi:hypothetical protein